MSTARPLFLGALLLAAGAASAQVARLELVDPGDTVRVGLPLRVLLTVRPPAGAFPLLPTPAPGLPRDSASLRLGDAVVTALERRPPAISGEARLDSAIYTVVLFALDSARVGPVPVRLVAGADTALVQAAAIEVLIHPVTAPSDSLRPPGPPLPLPHAWGPIALLLAGALVAVALVLHGVRRRGRRPARPSPHAHLPPFEEAMARLDALDAAPTTTAADVEAHHVELADIIRTYAERQHGLDAHRLTTSGLLTRLVAAGTSERAAAETGHVLREADMVKFAARRPDAAALAESRSRARAALAALRPAPEPAET